MTLGGLCLSGCCGCELFGDNFHRPDTSGSDARRLGLAWQVLSGSPQISGNTLEMSAGDTLAWSGGFTTLMGTFSVGFSSLADGTVFRIYMGAASATAIPSGNYVEYTYHPYVQDNSVSCGADPSSPQSTITAVGSTSASYGYHEQSLTSTFELDGSSVIWTCTGSTNGFYACIGQTGSAYHINGYSVAVHSIVGDHQAGAQANAIPAGPYVVLQLVSGSANVSAASANDVGDITTRVPPCLDCNSTCGCDDSRLSVTVAGLPSACLSAAIANGAFTLDCGSTVDDLIPDYNKCMFGGATIGQPFISFSYNPITNKSTVNGWITDYAGTSLFYQKITPGTVDCAGLARMELTYLGGGSGASGCSNSALAGSKITITAVT